MPLAERPWVLLHCLPLAGSGERLVVPFHVNLQGDVTWNNSDMFVAFEFQIRKEFLAGGDFLI